MRFEKKSVVVTVPTGMARRLHCVILRKARMLQH